MQKIKKSFIQTLNWFKVLIPMLIAIVLLISMIKQSGFFEFIVKYVHNDIYGVIFSDILWSISVWNAITSYIIADGFWKINSHILVITTFLIAWVTVGLIQIPAETYYFGKKFTIIRNILSFLFAILWAYLIYFLCSL